MHKGERDGCGFDGMKYLTSAFPRSGDKAKRGVEFRHSTRNVPRIQRKMGSGSVLMVYRES